MMINRSYSSIFIEEGGWTRYKQIHLANSVNLANNCSKKLGTLIGSAHVRTVRTTDADRPAAHFGSQQHQNDSPTTRDN
jgi:hypothetical protein